MRRILILSTLTLAFAVSVSRDARAERNRRVGIQKGPWIVYRYPLFGQSNRPPEARNHSQNYYWPSDANEMYPKFYGGFSARYFEETGWPGNDIGIRGTAW